MDKSFLDDVATGRLNVRRIVERDVLRARHLIRFANVVLKRSLKSADALIAVCCLDLALEKKQRVIFCIHDKPLYSTLQSINAYRAALELRYLQ